MPTKKMKNLKVIYRVQISIVIFNLSFQFVSFGHDFCNELVEHELNSLQKVIRTTRKYEECKIISFHLGEARVVPMYNYTYYTFNKL